MHHQQSVKSYTSSINNYKPQNRFVNCMLILIAFFVFFYTMIFCVYSYSISNCIVDSNSKMCRISQGCITNPFAIDASAEYTFIDGNQCSQFKRYTEPLKNTATKYSNPKLLLNEYIIGGLISRESFFGSLTQGCDGYGDGGNGHGIAQIDGRYSTPRLAPNGSQGTKVKYSTNKYGEEEFRWDSCIESINYVGAYLLRSQESLDNIIMTQLSNANLSTELDTEGSLKDSKSKNAYLRQILNSYNAGPGLSSPSGNCVILNDGSVNDSCTSSQNYSSNVLNRALDFMTCIDNIRDKKIEDLLKPTDNKNAKLQKCLKKNNDINGLSKGASNIELTSEFGSFDNIKGLINSKKLPYNIDFGNSINEFYSISNGKSIPAPPPETENSILFGECVSLVKQWQVFIGGERGYWSLGYPVETFKGLYLQGNKEMAKDNAKYITYGFNSVNAIRAGDIIILDPSTSPSSHTGIATGVVDNNQFEIIDQNWDGNKGPTRKSKYNNNTFIGAIRYIKK
jgi:hypothetical protein